MRRAERRTRFGAVLALGLLLGSAVPVLASTVDTPSCPKPVYLTFDTGHMAVAPLIGLPGTLYISPLEIVGGPGPEFFEVQL